MTPPTIELAQKLYLTNDPAGAERICRKLLDRYPGNVLAHSLLGRIAMRMTKLDDAMAHFRNAVKHEPERFQDLVNIGCCHMLKREWDAAIPAFEAALKINPFSAEALTDLGVVWVQKNDAEQGAKCHTQALKCDPNCTTAYSNRGIAMSKLGHFGQSLADFDRAIQMMPDYADAHWSRGLIRLLTGDFDGGWQDYEWRWQMSAIREHLLPGKQWNGEYLDGRLLVNAEQGYGDTIQFSRYLPMGRHRCREAVFAVQPEVLCLFPGAISQKEPLPAYDAWVPLLSLPRIFATNLDRIPEIEPPQIQFPEWETLNERVVKWNEEQSEYLRKRLDSCKSSSGVPRGTPGSSDLRIGIAWQGNPDHLDDIRRSFHPRLFSVFARLGVKMVSLQKGYGTDMLSEVDFPVERPPLDTFADTARIISDMDLVVTCDTVIAHLAGWLGKPTFVMLPEVPDWRWLMDREDSPWYPSLRLWRRRGSWEEVFERASEYLGSRSGIFS